MLKRLLIVTVLIFFSLGHLAFVEDSPEQVYKKYLKALQSKNLDEVKKYMSNKQLNGMNAQTPEMQQKMINMMAGFMPKSIRVTEQTISQDGKTANLKVTGIGGMSGNDEMSGTVAMVKEASGWKIEEESWSIKQP